MDNSGFEFLKDAFNKFAASAEGQELANRMARELSADAQGLIAKGLTAVPKKKIETGVDKLYSLVISPEASKGISTLIQKLDEPTIKKGLDKAIASLDNDKTALKVAQVVKGIIAKMPMQKIEDAVDSYAAERPLGEQMMIMMVTANVFPLLNAISTGSDAEVVKIVRQLASMIPTELVAAQAAAFTASMTPDVVAKQTATLVTQLPSSKAVAKIVHGIARVASKRLGTIGAEGSTTDLAKTFNAFKKDASNVIKKTVAAEKNANDNGKKQPPKKDGGSFKF